MYFKYSISITCISITPTLIVILCGMVICIAPLTGGYSEVFLVLAWQAGENKSLQTTKRRRWHPL